MRPDPSLAPPFLPIALPSSSINAEPRLRKLSAICLRLPESERTLRGDHADFRVRGKVFAYFLDNHHGDGIVAVCCKSELGENIDRVSREPGRYYLPAYIGRRGWFGLRLDLRHVDWCEVKALVESSYRLAAPRTLIGVLDAEDFPGVAPDAPLAASRIRRRSAC